MSTTENTCVARVVPQGGYYGHPCGRGARLEHEGRWYCKTHHPPTVHEKDEKKRVAWKAKWDAETAARQERDERAAEQFRKAYLFDELVAALRPFANYACTPPCDCHNCKARAVLKKAMP